MSKKLFTKVVSLSLAAAMVLSMAPVGASAAKKKKAKEVKPKTMKLTSKSKASKIKVGETKTIVATRKQKKTTAKVKYVKFTPKKTKNIGIKVTTSDDAVVSVEELSKGKYTYTGVTAGTATLTITSRAKTAKKKTLKAKLAVTVISPFRVTQTGSHTFTMSTADKLEKAPEKKDIMVRQAESEVDNAIKDVKLSADKMAVEVTMHVPFRDQQKYEVTFGKEKDSFVASVGVPDTIEIKTKTVVINKPTEVEYAIYDKNRMDVTKTLDENKITVSVDAKSGYYDTKKKELTLYRVGDKAEATVIYDTWTFDEKGNKNAITGKGTIEAVARDAVTVTGLEKYTIAETVLDWGTDEMVHKMPQGETKHIFVKMRKSDDSWVDNLGKEKNNFKFSHTDASVVTVDENGRIYAFRQGTAYVKVVYTEYNIKYEYTLPVEVGPPSSPSFISLSPNYVTISKNSPAETIVVAQVKDQYGEIVKVTKDNFATPEHLNGADVATIEPDNMLSGKAVKLKIKGNGKTGVGTYRISYGDRLNIVLTVNAIEVNSHAPISYVLKPVSETKFDSTVTKYTTNDDIQDMVEKNTIVFNLYEMQANVITGDAVNVIGKNQLTGKRIASVSIDGLKTVLDKELTDSENKFTQTASDVIEVNEAGNEIKIHPVLMKDNNVLLTHKDGNYTVRVVFWVKDKNDSSKFNKVILTQQYTIENKTKEGVQGSENDYEIEKIAKLPEGGRTAEFMAKEIVRPTGGAIIPDGQWTSDYFYTVSRGIGKWENTNPESSPNKDKMEYKMLYNLDKAPIPTFKTEEGKQIWTLKDHIARDVKLEKGARTNIAGGSSTPSESVYFVTAKRVAGSNDVTVEVKPLEPGQQVAWTLNNKAENDINAADWNKLETITHTVSKQTINTGGGAPGNLLKGKSSLYIAIFNAEGKLVTDIEPATMIEEIPVATATTADKLRWNNNVIVKKDFEATKQEMSVALNATQGNFTEENIEDGFSLNIANADDKTKVKLLEVKDIQITKNKKKAFATLVLGVKGPDTFDKAYKFTGDVKVQFNGEDLTNNPDLKINVPIGFSASKTETKANFNTTAQTLEGVPVGFTAGNVTFSNLELTKEPELNTVTNLTKDKWKLAGGLDNALKVKTEEEADQAGSAKLTVAAEIEGTADEGYYVPSQLEFEITLTIND